MVKGAVLLNGISELAIMKLDVLDGLKAIKICTAYKYKGKLFREVSYDPQVIKRAKPVYKQMRGWQEPTKGVKSYALLPANAKGYLSFLEDILGVKISLVSVGSSREETLKLLD